MSGHSKWSTIKRKKGAADAKRGQIFSKLIKEIAVAAKEGGGDINSNVRLKNSIDKARQNNMPVDNIERAIRRGTGADADASTYEEIVYEGYGPGRVAIYVEALTDNKNRTASDVRHAFTKCGGKLGTSGSVAFMFKRKGFIQVSKKDVSEERIFELAIDAGADNVDDGGEMWDIYTDYGDFDIIKTALQRAGIEIVSSELIMLPTSSTKVAGKDAHNLLKMIEMLEESDDVQAVWANFDIDEKELEAYQG